MDRFRYEVRPFAPIRDLIPGKLLRVPFTTDLTKEEVLHCMHFGPVFRKFPDNTVIRVTGDNLDSLHRESLNEEKTDTPSTHTEKVVEEQIQESVAAPEPKTDALTEEKVDETPEVEEETPDDDVEDNSETAEEDVESEEEASEDKVEETPAEESIPNNVAAAAANMNNHNNYKKKNKNKR